MKKLFLSALLMALAGCGLAPKTTFYKLNIEDKLNEKSLDRLLWENSLSADKNVQANMIVESDYANYYLVQVRVSEEPHLHAKHDAVVMLQSGRGIMHLKDQSFAMGPGSIVFIPRKVVHYFVNTGSDPAVAFVMFAPGYYGDDYVPIKPKTEQPVQ